MISFFYNVTLAQKNPRGHLHRARQQELKAEISGSSEKGEV